MGEEVIQHIFDPFYTTNKRTGTGLGMHIIYNLITQKLDGSIEVNSEVGEGAEFRMEFPFIEGGLSELK
jgi:two-component system, NtrC family, sensor kinase